MQGSTRRLDWVVPGAPPATGWELFALSDAPTGMKVKRAAPGGEGLVVDQLSPAALPRYLGWLDPHRSRSTYLAGNCSAATAAASWLMLDGKVGPLLAYWRNLRRMSQLALAAEAEVSPRHLSFIESGRASPSREMVLLLAGVLDVPLRERNTLLQAAGFAAAYRESPLAAPQLEAVRQALEAILAQHRPYPAVVLDRRWNIVATNAGAERFFGYLLAGSSADRLGPANVLRLIFHPDGLRPWITNWELVAEALIQRVHREAVGNALDDDLRRLLAEVLAYPGVPARWARPDFAANLLPIIPVCFQRDGRQFSYFSTVTVLGTPVDVTAQEVRIECFFPVDDETRRAAQRLMEATT